MKIATITCQHVYNYGATLQAYALQSYLEALGHEAEVIDYRLPTHMRYEMFTPYPQGRIYEAVKKFPLLRYVVCPYRNRRMWLTWGRKKAFDAFDARYLHLSSRIYRSIEELRQDPPRADIYVAGSDQIWNTFSENGRSPAYYLDFGQNVKRVAYAASLATPEIAPGWEHFVRGEVSKFDAVSVREKTGVELLQRLGIGDVRQVLDPVFLLPREKWQRMADMAKRYNKIKGPYVFLYDFLGNDNEIRRFAKSFSESNGYKIVSVNDFARRDYADINVNDAGPLEFLYLLSHAGCVISNSFHATAFSVIFRKEFYTFGLVGHHNSSRMTDFLKELGLEGRYNPRSLSVSDLDYGKALGILEKQIIDSKSFLKSVVH